MPITSPLRFEISSTGQNTGGYAGCSEPKKVSLIFENPICLMHKVRIEVLGEP